MSSVSMVNLFRLALNIYQAMQGHCLSVGNHHIQAHSPYQARIPRRLRLQFFVLVLIFPQSLPFAPVLLTLDRGSQVDEG